MSTTDTNGVAAAPASDLTFGEAMERLEGIVAQLEGDEALQLEQALTLYEQGVALAADCRRRLAGAELRLTEIAIQPPLEESPTAV
jgi:exodeoxyribonuclease VII small subunit